MKKERTTDPYGHLEFCIGSGDDFWCFDYATLPNGNIRLHAIINSETGSFIMNAEPPIEVPPGEAFAEATRLEGEAVDWCTENNVEHDAEGWDQDPGYFARAVPGRPTDPTRGRNGPSPAHYRELPVKTRNWRQPDCIALEDRPKIPVEDTRLKALAWSHKHPSPFRKRTRKERGLDR